MLRREERVFVSGKDDQLHTIEEAPQEVRIPFVVILIEERVIFELHFHGSIHAELVCDIRDRYFCQSEELTFLDCGFIRHHGEEIHIEGESASYASKGRRDVTMELLKKAFPQCEFVGHCAEHS